MSGAPLSCRCHGAPYTVCPCGCQYCPTYWPAGCPRCAEWATRPPTAERTLQGIDRVCTQRLLGTLTADQACDLVAALVGAWTDPDGPAGQAPRRCWYCEGPVGADGVCQACRVPPAAPMPPWALPRSSRVGLHCTDCGAALVGFVVYGMDDRPRCGPCGL